MRCYIKAFKNYCKCKGRASRKELWLFILFHYLMILILSFCDGFFGFYSTTIPLDYGYLTLAYLLISICPATCVQIRRLHDVNKSGKWWFLSNVPLVSLYLLYLYVKPGDLGTNEYGAPPTRRQHEKVSLSNHFHECFSEIRSVHSLAIETNPDKEPKIKFCRKCGFELIDSSEFCSKCGTAIVKE